jgi:hypothetical protein
LARAVDGLANEALLAAPIREHPLEGTKAGLAHALARQEPDRVIGPDGDDILEVESMQRADELRALAIEAVGQHDAEREPAGEQVLDDFNGQLGLGLVDIVRLETLSWLKDAEEEGEGRGGEQPVGVDRDDAIGQRLEVANVLVGDVVGGVALLAVPGLVEAQDERRRPQRLVQPVQPLRPQVCNRPFGVGEEVVQRLGVGVYRLAQPRQRLVPRFGE